MPHTASAALQSRGGFTLVELMIFVFLFSMVVAVMLPFLFSTTESRLRQQTIAYVEDNGTQAMQHMAYRIHNAERILDPPRGETGAVLALQMRADADHPTIFGVQTGKLLMIERNIQHEITSDQVAVRDFVVRNTSGSADEQSVLLHFIIQRTIRLQAPQTYDRRFERAVKLLPDHNPTGGCGCTAPSCNDNRYTWHYCDSGCQQLSLHMECP